MIRTFILCLLTVLSISNTIAQNEQAADIAEQFIVDRNGSFAQSEVSANDLRISSMVRDAKVGYTHVYFNQTYNGVDIQDALSSVHIKDDGTVFHHNNRFINTSDKEIINNQTLGRAASISSAAQEFGLKSIGTSTLLSNQGGVTQEGTFDNSDLALGPIKVNLVYVNRNNELILCWDVQFTKMDDHFMWNVKVDVGSGVVISKDSYTVSCSWEDHHHEGSGQFHDITIQNKEYSLIPTEWFENVPDNSYNIYPIPLEGPNHGPRSLVTEPWSVALNASPFGWHDTDGISGAEFTITRGNNVYAYLDRDGNGVPGFSPEGGPTLDFDYPINLNTESPVMYQDVAATNLFYMNNILHDVLYQYGFDEAAGNFQVNNYGNGGVGNDAVNAECQSGADVGDANNAFFGTPPDGLIPTMMMFEFTFTNPRRDSDLDNGIIAHEYAHGLSNRLTGGPGNTGCLNRFAAPEQMGEGWSDYITLILSMDAADVGSKIRGVGTYVLGQATNGPGIRQHPYSTDMAINPHTYADLPNVVVPHGVGSIWAEILWEMTWALIDRHGFNPDVYSGDHTTGGNILALRLVVDGMKLQPCSPGFVDGRDAILAADMALTGGDNQCELWTAFAKRGLGFSADQGESSSVFDGTAAFDEPPCAHCSDGMLNGDEEEVDCGGEYCPVCPTCMDGIMNGDEEGVDCGGPDCPVCPTCDDMVQNGDEAGVDCGGSACAPCPCSEIDLTKTYMNETVTDGTLDYLKDTITANGGVIIGAGTNVTWRAGKAIIIESEFTAENTGFLFIDIEDCEEIPGLKNTEERKRK